MLKMLNYLMYMKEKQIETGKKSMAYRIFLRSQDKTLNEDEIKASMDKILNILSENFNAQIRE